MKMEIIKPKYNLKKFTCPHCKSTTPQQWSLYNIEKMSAPGSSTFSSDNYKFFQLNNIDEKLLSIQSLNLINKNNDIVTSDNTNEKITRPFGISTCSNCNKLHLWLDEKMIEPKSGIISPPNEDMNEDIKKLYTEAAEVIEISPKSAGALLRFALQKYLKDQLGTKGDNINNDIKKLVSEKKIDDTIQQSLDYIRVIGNNAVHPLEINLDENKEHVEVLFDIFNFIVTETFSKPKEVKTRYDFIPEHLKNKIMERDLKN